MYESTKFFKGYSCAIRQWRASHSHCQLVHGYSFYFQITFSPINGKLDEMNWVQDFGSFKRNGLKEWLDEMFDHTTLIEKDDPYLEWFQWADSEKILKLVILDQMGAESVAKLVFDKFNERLSLIEGGRVEVVKVECFENENNSGIYKKQ